MSTSLGWDVTVGLASHWPCCITDNSGLSTYGLNGLWKGDEHPAYALSEYGALTFTFNSPTAIENLRSDLHNLVLWSNEWQMIFNIEKCKVMHLGYNNPKADYVMDGNVLQCVSEEKDLGG